MAEYGMVNGKYRRLPTAPTEFLDESEGDYLDTNAVATLLGVSRPTLNNWRNLLKDRYPSPEPDGKVQRGSRSTSWGWAWKAERKQEWLEWYENFRTNRKQLHCPCCRHRQPAIPTPDVGLADG